MPIIFRMTSGLPKWALFIGAGTVLAVVAVGVWLLLNDGDSRDARIAFVEPIDSTELRINFASAGRPDIGSPVQNTLAVQCPVWSPDGSRVAYIGLVSETASDAQLFVASADGSNRTAITPPEFIAYLGAAWSPDGAWIAVVSYADQNVYVMRPDGSDSRRLTEGGGVNIIPLWSPAGDRVLFTLNDGEIYAASLDGIPPRRLTDRPGFDVFSDWSPDGESIAFASEDGMYRMDADGSNVRSLGDAGSDGFSPIWSPDGLRLAFARFMADGAQIMVAEADGTNARPLVETSGSQGVFTWSPDSRQIAFTESITTSSAPQRPHPPGVTAVTTQRLLLYVVNVDGTGLRLLTPEPGQGDCPAWLPAAR